jgi:hypothetical protein
MSYTMDKGKYVIWTSKIFEAWDYPFNDEGENYTHFYKNLYDRQSFIKILAKESEEDKKALVGKLLGIDPKKIILRSKKAHNSAKRKSQR